MTGRSDESSTLAIFSGSGEMVQRIRENDWSKTALGPIEQWPVILTSTLGIILTARFPMAVYWGPEGFLFYNDAWRPIAGNKHPWALGKAAKEVWPEIWDVISPLFESVRQSGEGTWRGDELLPMQRFGYTEECYFDYTFNPIRGGTGKVEGILNVVQETTFRFLSERRGKLLREVTALTASAKSEVGVADACIAALATDPADIPFACFYQLPAGATTAQRVAATGLDSSSRAALSSISLAEPANSWPLIDALNNRKLVTVNDLAGRFGPIYGSAWPEVISEGLILPIFATPQSFTWFLVVGKNPRRQLDPEYSRFLELLASQTGAALTGARAYEEARERADALAELDRAKTAFFDNVSHELRTPLTLIKPFSARELHARIDSLLNLSRLRNEKAAELRNANEQLSMRVAELQAARKELQDSKARFDLVREATAVGFWFCDLPFDQLIWDKRVKEHFWLQPDEAVDINKFYERLHPDDRERTRQAIEFSIEDGSQYDIECRTVSQTGEAKWIRAIGRTFYDANDQPMHFDGVTLDITERKLSEIELQTARGQIQEHANSLEKVVAERTAKLRETVEELEAFSYSIAHDLRAPLRSLQNFSQFLSEEYSEKIDETGQDYLRRLANASARMDRLIFDILNYSRVVREELPLRTIDVKTLITEIVQNVPITQ